MPDTPLELRLASLGRDQLAALVLRLVDHRPELEDLVHVPLPGEWGLVDPGRICTFVTRVLRTMGDDWRASLRAEADLAPIVETGMDLERGGSGDSAEAVYRAVIDAILPLYPGIRDEESEVADIVGACVEGLGRLLARATEPGDRRRLLEVLFRVYRWDALDHGGYGMDRRARDVFLAQTAPDERGLVAAWVRAALPSGDENFGRWRRQGGGRLVLDLLGDGLERAAREAICAEADLYRDRLALLLEDGHRDEALELLREAPGDEVPGLADLLVKAGLASEAVAIARRHPALLDSGCVGLANWLERHDAPLGDADRALARDLSLFRSRPSIGLWHRLVRNAEAAGRRPEVLVAAVEAVTSERSHVQPVRVRVLAAAGLLDEAVAVLDRLPESAWRSAAEELVAQAESKRADIAVTVGERIVLRLRAQGTRRASAEARIWETRLDALRAGAKP